MFRTIDLKAWNRREHFEFFSQFDEPFFSITVDVDCTRAYRAARAAGIPFFLWYLYRSLRAANGIEAFRYRIRQEQVVCYDAIHASATINRADQTFGFSMIRYVEDEAEFRYAAQREIDAVRATSGLNMSEATEQLDEIHYSVMPWVNFTATTHARHYPLRDSVPKITFGKFVEKNGRLMMPVAVFAHHGLMDALHVARHLELFQELLDRA
jgi:chloramphenicol O-acetyltransferase type A